MANKSDKEIVSAPYSKELVIEAHRIDDEFIISLLGIVNDSIGVMRQSIHANEPVTCEMLNVMRDSITVLTVLRNETLKRLFAQYKEG